MQAVFFVSILALLSCSPATDTYTVSGRAVFAGDMAQGVPNAVIEVTHGAEVRQYAVDTAGFYSIELEAGEYSLRAYKRTDTLNGIDPADHAAIYANLLGTKAFENQWQWLASDVNGDGISTTYDAFLTNAAQLGVGYAKDFIGGFWLFVPADYVAPAQTGYFIPDYPTSITLDVTDDVENIDFAGFRRGDVSMSADPKK